LTFKSTSISNHSIYRSISSIHSIRDRCFSTSTQTNEQFNETISQQTKTQTNSKLPIAIIGSGPSAFYTTKYLLRQLKNVRVDM
jgi:hypothetical protein